MNREELRATVAGTYLRRSEVASELNGFIDLATARIGRELRTSENYVIETKTIGAVPYSLPATYREMGQVIAQLDGGPRVLHSATAQQISRFAGIGTPVRYSVAGYSLDIKPFNAGTFELRYWAQPAALADDLSTNDVLQAYPYLYLYATAAEAFISYQDADSAGGLLDLLRGEIRALNRQAQNAQAGSNIAMGVV